jgi:hypothetical protein
MRSIIDGATCARVLWCVGNATAGAAPTCYANWPRTPAVRQHYPGPLGPGSIGKEDTMDDIQVADANGVDLDLDVRIVEAGPVAAALLGSTDNGRDTQKSGDC